VTVTRPRTGPAAEKPAFWVDGNIHSTEVAASVAALYFLQTLVTQVREGSRRHPRARHRGVLRMSALQPGRRRMGARRQAEVGSLEHAPYPWDEDEIEGLTVEDIDGDGRILQMRIPTRTDCGRTIPSSPASWSRAIRSRPAGAIIRILPEGTMEAWDGFTFV
jgi:hypothetical protein